jgi:hypothetical protein
VPVPPDVLDVFPGAGQVVPAAWKHACVEGSQQNGPPGCGGQVFWQSASARQVQMHAAPPLLDVPPPDPAPADADVLDVDTPEVVVLDADTPEVVVLDADTPEVVVLDADTPEVVVLDADTPEVVVVDADTAEVVVVLDVAPGVAPVEVEVAPPEPEPAPETTSGWQDASAAVSSPADQRARTTLIGDLLGERREPGTEGSLSRGRRFS